jgi:phosphoglucosamine mutase
MLMTVMVETQLPLSVLASEIKMYPQVLKNVEVDDKEKTLEDPAVKKSVEDTTAYLGNDGRVLLRASGTEPVLRVMSEAVTYKDCEKCVDEIIDAMKQSGHLIKVRQ